MHPVALWHLKGVDRHGNQRVIAADRRQIDTAHLTQNVHGAAIDTVGHLFVAVNLNREIKDSRHFGVWQVRTLGQTDRCNDILRDTGGQGDRGVLGPFEPGIPDPRRHEDRQFRQIRRK